MAARKFRTPQLREMKMTFLADVFSSRCCSASFDSMQNAKKRKKDKSRLECILGDPGATCRDDAMFLGESLLQELKSPWELTLTEPVPEVVEFRPADQAEKTFFCPISEDVQPGNSVVVFFIDRPSCLARTTGRLPWKEYSTKPSKSFIANMFAISILLFLVARKVSRVPQVTYYFSSIVE